MATQEEVKRQISSLNGAERLLGRKEIKELPSILWDDEQVEHLVQGYYNQSNGLLVATNKRLIFVDKGWLVGLRVEDFPYNKISSMQYKTGFFTGEITVYTSGNKAEIQNVEKEQVRDFCESVRARISGPALSRPASPVPGDSDILAKLERLALLKSTGVLDEEEFAQQKQAILGSSPVTPVPVQETEPPTHDIQDWFDACCRPSSEVETGTTALWQSYKSWCRTEGVDPVEMVKFFDWIYRRGERHHKSFWSGSVYRVEILKTIMPEPRLRNVDSENHLEQPIEDFITQDSEVLNRGENSTLVRKKTYGSGTTHLVVFLLTAWWTFGIGNLLYAIIAHSRAEKVLVRIRE